MLFDDVNRFHQAPYRDDPFYALMLQAEFYVPLQHEKAREGAEEGAAGVDQLRALLWTRREYAL